ncbi:TPA: winged helix-turn-helix transcriptional regulator [Klebsiella pneumoniae]|nr:winged helix-turn-helix transcriptional regulator [Klebsiella pneumoniae]
MLLNPFCYLILIWALDMSSPCYCKNLRDFTRKMTAIYDAELNAYGINIAQYSLMRLVINNNPVSLTRLGDIAGLDRSTVGRNVTVLARKGWLQVDRDGMDKRQQQVSITPEGEALIRDAFPSWQRCQHIIEERLGADNVMALQNIFHQI